jgi:hypothetical protein
MFIRYRLEAQTTYVYENKKNPRAYTLFPKSGKVTFA